MHQPKTTLRLLLNQGIPEAPGLHFFQPLPVCRLCQLNYDETTYLHKISWRRLRFKDSQAKSAGKRPYVHTALPF